MALAINRNVARLVCSRSGREAPTGGFARPVGLCCCCPAPGKPLVFEYDRERVLAELRGRGLGRSDGPGIWRFAPMLPVVGVDDPYAADVGGTPIVHHARLSADLGVEVYLKSEGTSPSGSFKDRGLAVGVALGRACSARRFCLPTQGNAGVSACLFSARLGMPGCVVYMPDGYQGCIYHRACEFFGGEVRFAGPNIAAAGRAMRDELGAELARGEFVDISTFFEPGRLEGKKTMGLEIALHFDGGRLPDLIVYPTGGGTGLVGIWKAFEDLAGLGLLGTAGGGLPRMVAVQSANCAPVVEAFENGLDDVVPVESKGTIADGLDVPGAIMGHGILRAVRASGGTAVAVAEGAIAAAFERFGGLGVAAGFESAATLAALEVMRATGAVHAGERALLLLTGSHLIPLSRR
ncbi:MAG TPA: pyridoxal-phosphate dependent enzyme [Thermoanaerobaculaceae bacterium]|nr:pyridoxal-phosphate dependent enzyme [Thermoanaerobaculaceae bacterium]